MAGVLASESYGEIRRKDAAKPPDMEKEVLTSVKHRRWEKVVEIYKTNPSISTTINQDEDTILHVAIQTDKQRGVIKLMTLMEEQVKERMENLMQTSNKRGNTPLHDAAVMGKDEVCSFIAKHYCTEKVVCGRNKSDQTPLHGAARYGQKQAFFALQMVIETNGWRAKEGNTDGHDNMLHSAIAGEHFDLALKIVELYPELLQYKNHMQELPLHILASKPWAFKSGTHLNLLDSFIYHIIPQKNIEHEYQAYKEKGRQDLQDDHKACDARRTDAGDDKSKNNVDVESPGKVKEIKKKKTTNTYANRVMQKLVSETKWWQDKSDGKKPAEEATDGSKAKDPATPVLIATRRGVIEMVKEILRTYPSAIYETNSDGKNIVLLAAEYGQIHIYKKMLKRRGMLSSFGIVDNRGYSALHSAASYIRKREWSIPGAAFQMQSEIKWYKHVKNSMKPGFFAVYDSNGKTALKIFTNTHKDLMKDARDWLISTSESCSVVAALVAAVAYTSATSVPGGNNQDTGIPIFEGQLAFQVFAISSLVALCFSVTALVFFLSIVTSRFHELDFETALPTKLIGGMSTLFVSIAANFISFCAGHFYIIHNKLESRVYLLYGALSIPVMAFFLTSQLHLYVDLIRVLFSREPERSRKLHDF